MRKTVPAEAAAEDPVDVRDQYQARSALAAMITKPTTRLKLNPVLPPDEGLSPRVQLLGDIKRAPSLIPCPPSYHKTESNSLLQQALLLSEIQDIGSCNRYSDTSVVRSQPFESTVLDVTPLDCSLSYRAGG